MDVYDNTHMPMNRQQLGINNNIDVGVAQDTLNPNLKNAAKYLRENQFKKYLTILNEF